MILHNKYNNTVVNDHQKPQIPNLSVLEYHCFVFNMLQCFQPIG